MRTFVKLGILALIAFEGWGCARCNPDLQTVDAAVSIDRWTAEPPATRTKSGKKLVFYDVEIDERGLLLPQSKERFAYDDVVRRGFNWLVALPNSEGPAGSKNDKKVYYFSSKFTPIADRFAPESWPHNQTGLSAMLVRSALRYRDYSGDARPLDDARDFVDYVLARGLTSESDAWSLVPYASSEPYKPYHGAPDTLCCGDKPGCGCGDGVGFLEPDKVGEFGHALALLYVATEETRYLDAAMKCADALAKHVREGDKSHSPWPFRVDAKTGTVVRDPYSSNVIFAVQLLDELARIGRGNDAYARARSVAMEWLEKYPMKNMNWQGFFEDIPSQAGPSDNPNQYSPGETARYFLRRNESGDLERAKSLVHFIQKTFVVDVKEPDGSVTPAMMHGAETVSEQKADMAKMGSHTARYASLLAKLYEVTGDSSLRERASRAFAWATYCIDPKGVVKVGPSDQEGYWFSDGYGHYMIHFLDGMASVPAWVPRDRPHVTRSTTVIRSLNAADGLLTYKPFGPGVDELVVPGSGATVRVDGQELKPRARKALEGGEWLQVERNFPGDVTVQWAKIARN